MTRLLLGALAAAVLAGCASTGGIAPTAKLVEPAALGLTPAPSNELPAIEAQWWRRFDSRELDGLVERALQGSPSLQAAQARLARAEAAVAGTRAGELPRVDGSFDATRQRYTENGLVPPPIAGSMRTSATLQANLSWEVDFFGRNRAALEAALGQQRAAAADAQAARVLLAANVTRTWLQLARLVDQRAVAERTLAQRGEMLELVQQRVRAGIDTAVEQRQAEGALPDTRTQIEALDEQIALARHQLAALTVQAPDALDKLVPRLGQVAPQPVPAKLPADLLGRRADIVAARERVEAAAQDVKLARTQFYPSVDLVAFVGLSSLGLDRLIDAGSTQAGIGPALRLPLFDAGRLRANLRGRSADADAAVAAYNATLVDALRDTADQLTTVRAVERQRSEQALSQAAAESAHDLALQRYRAGLGPYLTVLSTETAVLAQRRAAVDLQARALDAQVALVRALGGGY